MRLKGAETCRGHVGEVGGGALQSLQGRGKSREQQEKSGVRGCLLGLRMRKRRAGAEPSVVKRGTEKMRSVMQERARKFRAS